MNFNTASVHKTNEVIYMRTTSGNRVANIILILQNHRHHRQPYITDTHTSKHWPMKLTTIGFSAFLCWYLNSNDMREWSPTHWVALPIICLSTICLETPRCICLCAGEMGKIYWPPNCNEWSSEQERVGKIAFWNISVL